MNSDELMNWLFRTALNGALGNCPNLSASLVGGINFNNPAIFRIENFPVYIRISGVNDEDALGIPQTPSLTPALPRLTVEDPRAGTVIAASEETGSGRSRTDCDEERQMQVELAPVPYRLYPHLVFDKRGHGQDEAELEIAPWVKAVMFGEVEYVEFTTLGVSRSRQRIHFDREDQKKLKGVGLNDMIPFSRNRRTTAKGDNIEWSFKPFPLGKATAVYSGHGDESANSILVTVDRSVYEAAWRLTGTDRRQGVFPQHFLLLRERPVGDNND